MSRPTISVSPEKLRRRFQALTRLPRKGLEQGEAIHQTRVLGKRLRAYLSLFREQLPQKVRRACKQKLSHSARALASSRNAAIISHLLQKLEEESIGKEPLRNNRTAEAAEKKALVQKCQDALAAMKEGRSLLLEKALPLTSAKNLQRQLNKSARQLRKYARQAGKSYAGPALHAWRKSLKRFFYQLELTQAGEKKTGRRLQKIEKRLGRIHDWDELLDHLKRRSSLRHYQRLRPGIEKRQQKEARRAFHEFRQLKHRLAA